MKANENGSKKLEQQVNHLLDEKSPYLLQHAYNPVAWYPWGDEAFALAEKQDKPVFLSIGYSTCHWCHVMAHESFENQIIAAYLNEHFISVKVDREELPGIDQIYMAATQVITGSGGWPMSLFLFSDKKPFYAGTYFPPQGAHGRPGFLQLLQGIETAWRTDRKSLSLSAEQVTTHIKESGPEQSGPLEREWLEKGFMMTAEIYDPKYGGFGKEPKFPRPVVLDFLLHYYKSSGEKEARNMALHTLDQMRAGGMYDHIGGGFHRYSVDSQWRIPHFEKMLYDQAQLAAIYLDAFQLNGNQNYRKTAAEIMKYVLRDLQDPEGGFYSAQDADSENPYNPGEHSEGAYFLWTAEEIDSLLSTGEASLYKSYYGVQQNGNVIHDPQQEFTGRNILYQEKELAEVAREGKISEQELIESLQTAGKKLLSQRQKRVPPHLDDKIITAWNGLMISALAKGYMVLGDTDYLQAAERAAVFVWHSLIVDGELRRRWRKGEARHPAGLDDYAFLIQGLLDLYQATYLPKYLSQSQQLIERQIALYGDDRGGFFDTVASADLFARMKAGYDGAEPSGNSVAALNCLRLASLTGSQSLKEMGKKTIESFARTLASYPPAMPLMLTALDLQLDKPRQIVIAGKLEGADTQALLQEVHSHYLPNTTVLLVDGGENQIFLQKNHPYLAGMAQVEGKATAYICEDFTCKLPVNTRKALSDVLHAKAIQCLSHRL